MITRARYLVNLLFSFLIAFYSCGGQLKVKVQEKKHVTVTNVNDSISHKIFYFQTGKKEKEFDFNRIKNQLFGKYWEWDESGNLILEWNYYNGKRDGKQIDYWETGKLSLIQNYYRGSVALRCF
jgi:antitoxin component YwqK of YwqJK toxin-antitoxin module